MKTIKKTSWAVIIPAIGLALIMASWTTKANISGQNLTQKIENLPGEKDDLDKNPQFAGGQKALFQYIGNHVEYPQQAKQKGLEGTVHISFVVEASGEISAVSLKRGVHELLDAEALRVIKMMPNWEPGEKDGKKVKAEMVLPITFKL